MPFGKHRGKSLDELPEDYIVWLIEECEDDVIREHAEEELSRRKDHPTDERGITGGGV